MTSSVRSVGRTSEVMIVERDIAICSPGAKALRWPNARGIRGNRAAPALSVHCLRSEPVMIPFHPLAEVFPLIEGDDFDELVKDIRQRGLRERIELLDGVIIDGRNRYLACIAAGLIPEDLTAPNAGHLKYFHSFVPAGVDAPSQDELLAYVISKNLRRRQLNESQRAQVAARLGKLQHGGDRSKPSIEGLSAEKRAAMLNVGRASVERADAVESFGISELQRKVETGELRISTAAMIARLPKDEQVKLLREAAPAAVKAAAKEINAQVREERRANVNALHAALSINSAPLPLDRRYPVIYADPATRFEAGFSGRSIENHYPTETIEDWCKLPVRDLALDHSRLFVWTTIPQLGRTIELLLPAWGFTYASSGCWDKTSPDHERESATGYWFRNQHEILLLATRGAPALPKPADVPVSMYRERKGAHSAKPDFYREMIEKMTPGLPRIELFARSRREGWEVWGNQAPLPPQDPNLGAAPKLSQFANDADLGQAIRAPTDTSPPVDEALLDIPDFLKRPVLTSKVSEVAR
jgi:N6-adenosine-specific RNA methylase IME4